MESRARVELAHSPGCSRWPYRLGDLDKSERAGRDSVHHRSPGQPYSEETERVELSERRTLAGVAGRCAEPTGTSSPDKATRGEWRNRTPDPKVTLVFGTSSAPRGALSAGGRGIEPRWRVLETRPIPDRCPWSGRQDSNLHRPRSGRGGQPVDPHPAGVTARYRSGTFAFTARCAEPLHHGHHS